MKFNWQLKAPQLTCPKCGYSLQPQRYKPQSKNPLQNNSVYYQCLSCHSYFYTPNRTAIKHILILLLFTVPFVLLLLFGMEISNKILTGKTLYEQLGMAYHIYNIFLLIAIWYILIFFITFLIFIKFIHWIGQIQSRGVIEIPAAEIKRLTPLPPLPENNLIKDIKALSLRQQIILLLFTVAVIAVLVYY